jgi:hypothetical protein
MITPRVTDFMDGVDCHNADEATMEGDPVGQLPEYLKYTHVATNGKTYCSSIIDLYRAVKSGQTMDPYRRFDLDKEDIIARYEFLKKIIEPHGMGEGIMSKIRDTLISFSSKSTQRSRLIDVWVKLHYPKFTTEEIMEADESLLNGIWASLTRQEGINVTASERNEFQKAAGNTDKKRNILIETMYRISNITVPNDTNLVALGLAINDSSPQGTIRPRDEDEDDEDYQRSLPRVRYDDYATFDDYADSDSDSDSDSWYWR